MRLVTAVALLTSMTMPAYASETAANAQPLSRQEFMESIAGRQVELSRKQLETLGGFLKESQQTGAAELLKKVEDRSPMSLGELLPRIVNKDGSQPFLSSVREHPDVLLRFIAGCGLAGSGDSDASAAVHALLHDKALAVADKRAIKTWAAGAGIDAAKDDAKSILQHLMNLMGKSQRLKFGDASPDFTAKTQAGVELDSTKLRGKTVVLHFWSSSCAPCLAQMSDHIGELSQLSSDEAVVVFVSLDEDQATFEASVKEHAMPFHNVCDGAGWGGDLARMFGVKQLPFDIVIDANGKIFSNSIKNLPVDGK